MDANCKNVYGLIGYAHTRRENPEYADFHLHDLFEIYFFISGNVHYFIEKKVYTLHYGDLLLMNSQEIHKPSCSPGEPYERITIHFDAAIHRL
jgi:quercetin dioxygenase-like cupin family protein